MDGFLSFLLFALFFYLMMRFGCGAHMVHGHHGRADKSGLQSTKHLDPVCGKDIPPNEGYGMMHAGNLYRFCSRQCLDEFETKPERYMSNRNEVTS